MGRGLAIPLLAWLGTGANAAPFPSTDHNPLLGGLTFTAPARLSDERYAAQLTFNWSSTAAIQQAGNDLLIVDAEIREWRLSTEYAVGPRIQARVHMPLRSLSGGSLDEAIETWHDLFGLPNGSRDGLPSNRLWLELRHGSTSQFDFRDQQFSGLGDFGLELGWQIQADPTSATSLWSGVTLPTGAANQLLGSGTSGSLLIAHTRSLGRIELFGHAGMRVGDHDGPLAEQRKPVLWLGMVGFDLRVTPRTSAVVQLDAHSAAFAVSRFDLMDAAYILTLGGTHSFANHWQLQLSIAEDVKAQSSADVMLSLALRKTWGVPR